MAACSSDPEVADAGPTAVDATVFPDAAATAFPDAAATAFPDAAADDVAPGPLDAAADPPDTGSADAAAALLPYGAPCGGNAECETGLCDRVEMRNICTSRCTNNVCPHPNSSCNNRGVCRPD